jgi:hypothetical protein
MSLVPSYSLLRSSRTADFWKTRIQHSVLKSPERIHVSSGVIAVLALLHADDGDTEILRNVGKYSLIDTE